SIHDLDSVYSSHPSVALHACFVITPPPPKSTLFPYTTLFRSIRRTAGKVRLPGSKSISNRVLLLAALASGDTEVSGLLDADDTRSEEHTSELQSLAYLVCRLLLEKKKMKNEFHISRFKNKNNR